MSTEWTFTNRTALVVIDEIATVTLRNRLDDVERRLTMDLNMSLYGDRAEPPRLTARQRFFKRAEIYRNRIADAWLVLTGRADIDGGY